MAAGCGWDNVLSAELEASHTFEDEVLSCEAARTPSTCAEDDMDDGPKNMPAVWWAVLLKSAGVYLGIEAEGMTSTSQAPPGPARGEMLLWACSWMVIAHERASS